MEVESDSSNPANNLPDETFQDLFKQHYAPVVRKVLLLVKEQSVAEDIAQEVFMKLYHTDRTTINNISGWLAKVAVHTAYNHIRTEQRHRARAVKQEQYERHASGSVEDRYLELEDIEDVQQILQKLPERDRDILLMKFSGYSYEEIAKSNGVEQTSIGALLVRAKNRFKKIYLEERTDIE